MRSRALPRAGGADLTLPPDQEGGAASPPPIDQETAGSPEAGLPTPVNPRPATPLTERLVEASGLPAALVERLRRNLDQALGSPADLSLIVGIAPITVRAAEPSTVTAGRLELPDGTAGLLGEEIETHVLADGERLRVWLAGTTRVQPGSAVTLIAITAAGEIAEATAVADASAEDLELSLPWADAVLPEVVSLAFGDLR
jgi:hypothetical protein